MSSTWRPSEHVFLHSLKSFQLIVGSFTGKIVYDKNTILSIAWDGFSVSDFIVPLNRGFESILSSADQTAISWFTTISSIIISMQWHHSFVLRLMKLLDPHIFICVRGSIPCPWWSTAFVDAVLAQMIFDQTEEFIVLLSKRFLSFSPSHQLLKAEWTIELSTC